MSLLLRIMPSQFLYNHLCLIDFLWPIDNWVILFFYDGTNLIIRPDSIHIKRTIMITIGCQWIYCQKCFYIRDQPDFSFPPSFWRGHWCAISLIACLSHTNRVLCWFMFLVYPLQKSNWFSLPMVSARWVQTNHQSNLSLTFYILNLKEHKVYLLSSSIERKILIQWGALPMSLKMHQYYQVWHCIPELLRKHLSKPPEHGLNCNLYPMAIVKTGIYQIVWWLFINLLNYHQVQIFNIALRC